MEEVKISTAGDSALLIEFGQEISTEINARITAFVHLLKAQRIEGVQDMIPAFTSLLINYDPRVVNYKTLTKRLQKLLKLDVNEETSTSRVFEIPVCYGGEYGYKDSFFQRLLDLHAWIFARIFISWRT